MPTSRSQRPTRRHRRGVQVDLRGFKLDKEGAKYNMKITKSQLKQIIEEESNILLEQTFGGSPLRTAVNPKAYRKCESQDIEKDALAIYDALKGIDWFGAGETVVQRIWAKNPYDDCIRKLYIAFEAVLRDRKDTADGDLYRWLKDDGLKDEAEDVRRILKIRL